MYQPTVHGAGRDRGIVRPLLTAGVVVGSLLLAASVVGVNLLQNPLRTETVDHSPAPILTELRDLADFHAAQAQFEVVIDQERDVNLLPQFVAGERVQFVAVGNVDAVVDFALLDDAAIDVDEEASAVTIELPAARIEPPVIDHDRSYVMNRDRGLLDRVGGALVDNPTGEQQLLLAAEDKMSAAAGQSDLLERAEDNTTKMLTGMLGALGYDQVTVVYDRNAIDVCSLECATG